MKPTFKIENRKQLVWSPASKHYVATTVEMEVMSTKVCRECQGAGRVCPPIPHETCRDCDGTGEGDFSLVLSAQPTNQPRKLK